MGLSLASQARVKSEADALNNLAQYALAVGILAPLGTYAFAPVLTDDRILLPIALSAGSFVFAIGLTVLAHLRLVELDR